MSNASRFDKLSLLSSTGGHFFNQFILQPDYNLMQCDVRLVEDDSPFLNGTKCMLLTGDLAMHKYIPTTRNNNIHECRGGLYKYEGIPCIPTYLPQDCVDAKNYEKEFNKEASGFDEDVDENEDASEGDLKGMSKTKRGNYAFWLYRDSWKAKRVLSTNIQRPTNPKYVIFPSALQAVDALEKTKNSYFYFDIETDYEEQNLLCFAFSFDGNTIYSVPILDYNYKWAYTDVHKIMRALVIAVRDNITVAHNGHAFDFLVLAMKYHIAVNRCYDTMIAMHRCFPGVEKSLGHCISYWTWEQFHKDEDSKQYRSYTDMMNKLSYCAKDVYGMYLVHKEITTYAKTIPGLEASIKCGNDSIVPYLTTTMQGILYNPEKIKEIVSENDRLMMQYIRICDLLIGKSGMEVIKKSVKSKNAGAFPGSRKQVCEYFHNILGYPVIFRSKDTGEPSLGKKTLFKLQIKHNNPVIQFVNMYRQVQKESSALRFNAWKSDDGKILPRRKENI